TRQHPLKGEGPKPLHRPDLLLPGIPAVILGGTQLVVLPVPPEMISGEQKAVLVEQDAVSGGVSRSGDRQEVGAKVGNLVAFQYNLGLGLRRQLRAMNDPLAAEAASVQGRVCHIIAVRQKQVSDAAPCFKLLSQEGEVFGRINQPVPLIPTDK